MAQRLYRGNCAGQFVEARIHGNEVPVQMLSRKTGEPESNMIVHCVRFAVEFNHRAPIAFDRHRDQTTTGGARGLGRGCKR